MSYKKRLVSKKTIDKFFDNKSPQKKAWETRRLSLCIVCKLNPKRSKTAKTCCQSCAGKLAWESRSE